MSSDTGGESTSTDSDIGTSPSGTTIASPPSSPQQPSSLILNLHNHNRLNNNNINKNNPEQVSSSLNSRPTNFNEKIDPNSPFSNRGNNNLNNAIIRQHSYLNAVQLNDFKLNLTQKQSKSNKKKNFFFRLTSKMVQ